MQVRIDYVKDIIEVVNPLTGLIEKAEKVKTLKETDSYSVKIADSLTVADALAKKLQEKVTFLESKLTTLSIDDWNKYSEI